MEYTYEIPSGIEIPLLLLRNSITGKILSLRFRLGEIAVAQGATDAQDEEEETITRGVVRYLHTSPADLDYFDKMTNLRGGSQRFAILADPNTAGTADLVVYPSWYNEESVIIDPLVRSQGKDFIGSGIIARCVQGEKEIWGTGLHSWRAKQEIGFEYPADAQEKKLLEEYALRIQQAAFGAWTTERK